MSPSFGLPQSTLDEMRAIFARHNKVTKVVVYGSRAKGNYRNGSDIDLTMFGKNLTFQDLSTIHNALDDSSNPYLVNLSIYNHLDNAKLREHIDRVGQVFYYRYEGWKKVKLGDVVSFVRGLTYSKKDEVDLGGLAVLRATNISLEQRKIIYDEIRHIRPQEKLNKDKLAKVGDLLMCTASGSKSHLGKVALVTENLGMAFGGFMAALRCNASCSPNSLFYVLTSNLFMKKLSSISEGANINNLKFSQIEDFEFQLPPLAEQQRIVAKLDAAFAEIDEAIDLARQKNDNNSILLNQFLATIKADTAKLDDIVQIKTGKLDANAMVEGGEYPFFTCSKQIYEIDKFAFDCDAVLLAGNNASGDFNVKHYIGKFNAYQRTYVITVKDTSKLRSRYLYFQLIQALAKFKTMSVGTNTKFLKLGMIKDFEIPLPTLAQQDTILEKLQKLEQNLKVLEDSSSSQLSNYFALKSAILAQQLQSEVA